MVYQRMFQGVTMLFLAGATFAACGSPEPQTQQEKYCAAKCDCNKCTPTESSTCLDDIVNLADEAQVADCKDLYETYLSCLIRDGACTDGNFDDSACFNEETDLKACMNPPPVCATANDGKCNEPMPKGDGTCAAGSDTKDCTPPPCPTTNNGICDEPEGTNTCLDGSDAPDCPPPMCLSCLAFFQNPQGGTLCATSTEKHTALYSCACDSTKCATDCDMNVCSIMAASPACLNCANAMCTMAYQECVMDTPAP